MHATLLVCLLYLHASGKLFHWKLQYNPALGYNNPYIYLSVVCQLAHCYIYTVFNVTIIINFIIQWYEDTSQDTATNNNYSHIHIIIIIISYNDHQLPEQE